MTPETQQPQKGQQELTPRAPITATMRSAVNGGPELRCSAEPIADGHLLIHYELRNLGDKPIYILAGHRMPYLLAPDAHTLVVLHGINPPDPNVLYNMIETPLTRTLPPGESFTGQIGIPNGLRDHYSDLHTPENMFHGKIQIRCQMGWGQTPITEDNRVMMPINKLLAWQQLVEAGPLSVVLP